MNGELTLKYGCNPHQSPARVFVESGKLPIDVLNGRPGYINLLDALNAWQLVRELSNALGMPAAASFKHTSPAGAAAGLPLDEVERAMYHVGRDASLTPVACAYIRARGADRMSSFGDFAALSHTCDKATALYLKNEVSDGIIAPDFEPEALDILKSKRGGNYTVIRIDTDYTPDPIERKQVFGVTFEQKRNDAVIDEALLKNIVTLNKEFPESAKRDLIVSLITLKYTQSNSVCFAMNGQAIGVGAGQQSRIHCTRLAAEKAELWWLRHHEKALSLPFIDTVKRPDRDNAIGSYLLSSEQEALLADGSWQRLFTRRPEPLSECEKQDFLRKLCGVSLGSDAFFPFSDNIDRAKRAGVSYIAEPGGSIRDDAVIAACDAYGMTMAFTGLRLFHH